MLNFQIAIVALRPKQFARPAILRNLNYQVLPVSVLLATTPIRRVRFARLVPTTATPVRQPLPAWPALAPETPLLQAVHAT